MDVYELVNVSVIVKYELPNLFIESEHPPKPVVPSKS